MSLITRCPACMTLFRVVPDQLRISEGWVRCGQCDEVFDGNLHLQSHAPAPAQADTAAPEVVTPQPEAPAARSEPYDWGEVLGPADPPPPAATEGAAQVLPPEDFSAADDELPDPQAEEMLRVDADPAPELPEEPHLLPEDHEEPVWRSELDVVPEPPFHALDMAEVPVPMAGEQELPAPTFMQAQAVPEVQPVQMRLRLVLLSLVLGLLLLVQLLWQERDVIAATHPSSKPVLQNLCAWVGCEIHAPRQIDALQIESSAFAKVRTDVYQLQFTLRNAASTELALPAMELTLTDASEKAVLRKVFPVESFGLTQDSLPVAGDVSVSIPVTLVAAGLGERIAGYRLLAFYP